MPNWCIGTTIITGEKRNIRNFLDRFLSYDEDNEEKPKKYFARSFIINTIAKEKENLKINFDRLQTIIDDLDKKLVSIEKEN